MQDIYSCVICLHKEMNVLFHVLLRISKNIRYTPKLDSYGTPIINIAGYFTKV